jgi:hypothetical protein
MHAKRLYALLVLSAVVFFVASSWASPPVIKDGKKIYIVDRHGERWDVTQAKSIGFKPERFQYGIGRYAFTPLDDALMTDQTEHVYDGLRVIGVRDDTKARAYSVPKLRGHEIANSQLGSEPIAVGY